jgi:thioesterase domain-containing protein/aryl carrier-like protein
VGRRDNFFDLGGDSLKASELQARLLRTVGMELPLQDLVNKASVQALATLILDGTAGADEGSQARSVLVPVRPAGSKPNLFLVHGALGQAFISPGFLAALGEEQPLYAFQARGLDGTEPTNRSVADMAADYIRALHSVQPRGPYTLCGLCAGSIVALEMARQLQAADHRMGLVLLIDPPRSMMEGYSLRRKIGRSLSLRLARLSRLWGGGRRTQEIYGKLRRRAGQGRISLSGADRLRLDAAVRVALDFKLAVLHHRPKPYHGAVQIIGSRRREGALRRWRRLVTGPVRFVEAGAEHDDLLEAGNHAFAEQLRRCLDGA